MIPFRLISFLASVALGHLSGGLSFWLVAVSNCLRFSQASPLSSSSFAVAQFAVALAWLWRLQVLP